MLTLGEINSRMQGLESWSLQGDSISKDRKFSNFKEALVFVNKVGEIAELKEHHPDIVINYNKVKLVLTTHDEGGLSEKDFEVAKEIDKL